MDTWFKTQFNDLGLAVVLAALYGPFQTVGRLLEMAVGHRFDARITGMIAFIGVPTALILAQQDGLAFAIVAMMIFGMGHGILTVSFGYVTNMYFSADVYGRAKGWITTPRALGTAIGPSLGGVLFLMGPDIFFTSMIGISSCQPPVLRRYLRQNRLTCLPGHPVPREDALFMTQ